MAETGQYYKRPVEGFRFTEQGLKTNVTPDAIPPNRSPYCQNIRGYSPTSVRVRPGLKAIWQTVGSVLPITDIGSYAALNTDDAPFYLVRNSADQVFSLAGANVGSLAGGGSSPGASMIPFRPAQSPNPWMYVANGSDYQKFSAPSGGVVTQRKVGIAEPQTPCDAGFQVPTVISFQPIEAGATAAGTASVAADANRVTDTVQHAIADPTAPLFLYTLGVSSNQTYTKQMLVTIAGGGTWPVQDVYPANPQPMAISAIYYYNGNTGPCVIAPNNLAAGPGTEGESLYTQNLLSALRRGSLVTFAGGIAETCLVLSVTEGPNGTVCFETSTINTHTAAETLTSPQAIQVATSADAITVGAAIDGFAIQGSISGAGIGTVTYTEALQFMTSGFSFQPEDYLHFSINMETLSSLIEAKLLLDVGDGSFTENFYYYTIRVSDIEAGIQNTLTQLGAAQLVSQRATIDEEKAAASNNQLSTASSSQTTPGDGQWAEVIFPISALTRVGSDQTKSLQNVGKVQFLFNTGALPSGINYPVDYALSPLTIWGGSQPDVGQSGAPYLYRVRPRSSVTGVKGNPSPEMRYGVNPRRATVAVTLPSATYDSQIDTWDIYRYGGSVTSYRWIGQTPITNQIFFDNYSDEAALEGDELELDNLEPWPTIDVPFSISGTIITVIGTTIVVTIPTIVAPANILRWLPGNEVRVGSANVYTLRQRPTLLGVVGPNNIYLLQLQENAGYVVNPAIAIYEPATANQHLPYMWGPDAEGTVFAVGDPLRPGTFSFAKSYVPDSAPDSYNIEEVQPSEPLLGGEIINGLSYVASPAQWWALYPQTGNSAQRYSPVKQPLPRGLAAPWGHCNDGKSLYWWAKDGIYSSSAGSLTDADLYNLFPHEGVVGANYTYGTSTVYAPDYSRAGTFRLTYCNSYLYATYQDTTGTPRSLTLDTRTGAWYPDGYQFPPTVLYALPQQPGTLLSGTARYPSLVAGDIYGNLSQPTDLSNDIYPGPFGAPANNFAIPAVVATREWDGGDLRASQEWGDLWMYLLPIAQGSGQVTCQPMALSTALGAPTVIPPSATKVQTPISLGGGVLSDFLGVRVSWTDDFSAQNLATVLEAWQPSYLDKPEFIADRFTDWYDGGTEKAKFVQGFLLHADTFNTAKGIVVRDSDTLATHAYTPAPIMLNGEQVEAYSFNTPFVAHMMRLEPTDQVPWRFWDVQWVWEPTPEYAETWTTQGTSFGYNGYSHIPSLTGAYVASAPVVVTVSVDDGTAPAPITLPATGGAYQKLFQMLTFNKGQLYFFSAISTAPFALWLDDWEIRVGNWGREGPYVTHRNLGGSRGDKAAL